MAVHVRTCRRFARICKTFRNRRPRSAATRHSAGKPTPIFRGRLRCAAIGIGLSRRRPRVRVPSTPPTILKKINGFLFFAGACLQTGRSPRDGLVCKTRRNRSSFHAIRPASEPRIARNPGLSKRQSAGTPRPPAQIAAGRGTEKFDVDRGGRRGWLAAKRHELTWVGAICAGHRPSSWSFAPLLHVPRHEVLADGPLFHAQGVAVQRTARRSLSESLGLLGGYRSHSLATIRDLYGGLLNRRIRRQGNGPVAIAPLQWGPTQPIRIQRQSSHLNIPMNAPQLTKPNSRARTPPRRLALNRNHMT